MILTDDLLIKYKRCSRHTFLNFYGDESQQSPEKDFCLQLKKEKITQSQEVLHLYNLPHNQPSKLSQKDNSLANLASITEKLMSEGVECIYQGVIQYEFKDDRTQQEFTISGSPTLLIKDTQQSSRWGNWSYFAVNTHLGRSNKKEYKLISGLHAYILSDIQKVTPQRSEIVLRNSSRIYRTVLSLWMSRAEELVTRCASMLSNKDEPEIFISRQRCSLCPWYDSCYTIAKVNQHLSLIAGITPSRLEVLLDEGIYNFPLLAQTPLSILELLFKPEIARAIYKQTQSLHLDKPIAKRNNLRQIPTAKIELYFDIEAQADRHLHYLLGVLVVNRDTQETEYHSFLAKTAEEEETIWQKFVEFVNQYENAPIFHYAEYEAETIKLLANLYHTSPHQLESLLNRCFDLHQYLITSWYFPIQNYSLKSVANWLDFYWRDPITGVVPDDKITLAGDQCVFWYEQWINTNQTVWLDYILIYNYDDCFATYKLKECLDNLLSTHENEFPKLIIDR